MHDKLDYNFDRLFEPVYNYMDALDDEYNGLYSAELVYEINSFIDENHSFEEVVEKREHFQVRKEKKKLNEQIVINIYNKLNLF